MAAGFEVDASGVARFAGDLETAGQALEDLTALNQRQGSAALAGAVIPRRTGHLAETAYVAADETGFALSATAPYAGYVHARDPFFTRALDPEGYLDALETHTAEIIGTIQGD
jgi:hypothetical protein